MTETENLLNIDYQIDLVADIKCVATTMQRNLTNDQIDTIAFKVFSNYSFNDWIEELIEDVKS